MFFDRFIHCTKEEEETYHKTKKLPLRLKYQYDFGIGDCFVAQDKLNLDKSLRLNESAPRPLCRDFVTRECLRGDQCKFFHPDVNKLLTSVSNETEQSVKRPRIHIDSMEMDCGGNDHNMMKYPINEFEQLQHPQNMEPPQQQHIPNNIAYQGVK